MEESEQCKLFVGGVSWVTTEEVLKEHFSKYGTVASTVIARDRNTGSPRGFAFVSFTDSSAVAKALGEETHNILGRTVDVKRAIPRGEQNKNQVQQSRGLSSNSRSNGRSNEQSRTKKIFVGGLSANLTEDEFKSYFEQFGRITDVVVMHDNVTQRPRGFGFITFDSEDAVEDVMLKSFHELGGKHAEVKRAIPKDGNNNGYNSRVSSKRWSNFSSYQNGNFQPYSPRYDPFQGYGQLSGYGPLLGYGGVVGYPYGVGMFGGGYPTGGYGAAYGMTPFAPRSEWTGVLPYSGSANYYSAYMNGRVGITGGTSNGYNGILGTTQNGKSSQLDVDDAQMVADRTLSQIERRNVDVSSLSSGGSCDAAATKMRDRGIDGQLISYSAGDSS